MSEIIPAVLAQNISDLHAKISQIPDEARMVHLDILEEDIWTDIGKDLEVHLMVKEPEVILNRWIERGAKRIIIHSLGSPRTKRPEIEIGLGVELHIQLEEIYPLVPEFSFIHLMSIAEIGVQGRPLDERIFDRIKEVKKKFPQVLVNVDGGINLTNYQALMDLGVERLIIGSGFKDVWKSLTKK